MRKESSRIFLGIIIFLITGIALYFAVPFFYAEFFWSEYPKYIQKENLEQNGPISAIYRYDQEEKNYVPDQEDSWQNKDFTRYIYDTGYKDAELDKCYYFLYDSIRQESTIYSERKCNSNLTITVGENKDCLSQGENVCVLYVYAIDKFGRKGEMDILAYHIDWEKPKVGKVFTKENQEYPIKIEKFRTFCVIQISRLDFT